ncbi:unnamed protein product [Rhodiola kirilowii]
MDLREGQNITRPPLLEGNNYGYWRVRMKAFLKSQDESVWEAVEHGWTHPMTTDAGKVNLLAKDKWTEIQKSAEAANSKAMNVIFSGVDGKNFKMISEIMSPVQVSVLGCVWTDLELFLPQFHNEYEQNNKNMSTHRLITQFGYAYSGGFPTPGKGTTNLYYEYRAFQWTYTYTL